MIKKLPSNAGDLGLIPGPETKSLQAMAQLSPCTAATRSTSPKDSSTSFTGQLWGLKKVHLKMLCKLQREPQSEQVAGDLVEYID